MTATKITVKRVCELCGKEFLSQKITTRFCSKDCANKAYKMRLRLKNVQQSEKQTEEKPVLNLKDKEYLSVNEAAIVLGLSRRSAYNLIYKGILRATRFSEKLTIIKRSDIWQGNCISKARKKDTFSCRPVLYNHRNHGEI